MEGVKENDVSLTMNDLQLVEEFEGRKLNYYWFGFAAVYATPENPLECVIIIAMSRSPETVSFFSQLLFALDHPLMCHEVCADFLAQLNYSRGDSLAYHKART